MAKTKYILDKDFLEKEELEAKERGLTIFQLRQVKKTMEMRNKRLEEYRKKRKRQTELKKEREKKKKEKEKLRKKQKQEERREKDRERKERLRQIEKEKKEKYLAEHPIEKPKKKRPVGRPKKRGPKKKYKRKPKNWIPPEKKKVSWNYKIVICRNNRQVGYVGKYIDVESAYNKMDELLENSKKVIYPMKTTHSDTVGDNKYEYLILERKNDDNDVVYLRNDIGKMVEQKTDSEKWAIYDKFSFDVEETFWVWGYNNKNDRKTFMWIYDNILMKNISIQYSIVRILIYKNKIIFKYDDDTMDIVFCKTISDAIRFYNLLQDMVKKNKIRQVFFLGQYNDITDKRRKLENDIMELTGWPKKKIQMSSTSEHIKNKKT